MYENKKNDNNIIDGCFVLISTKLCKKGNTFKVKNAKGKLCFRIPEYSGNLLIQILL